MTHPTPKQERSRHTEQRLLTAAEELIAEGGLSGLSIAEVVRRANSSVGSFYGRFKDKSGLLQALHRRRMDEISQQLDTLRDSGAIAQLDLSSAALICMTQVVEHYTTHSQLIAASASCAAAKPNAWAPIIDAQQELIQKLAAILATSQGPFEHPNPTQALVLSLQLAFSFLGKVAIYTQLPAPPLPFPLDTLPRELATIVTRYLSTPP